MSLLTKALRYATYAATGIGILLFCVLYYAAWVWVLPKIGDYTIRQEIIQLGGGETTHCLIKVPNAELAQWDAKHDATGKKIVEAYDT